MASNTGQGVESKVVFVSIHSLGKIHKRVSETRHKQK